MWGSWYGGDGVGAGGAGGGGGGKGVQRGRGGLEGREQGGWKREQGEGCEGEEVEKHRKCKSQAYDRTRQQDQTI